MTTSPRLLQSLLTHSAQCRPDQAVFIQNGVSTTYAELDRASNSFAAALQEVGLAPADRVLLVLDSSVHFLIAYYGILKAGAVVVPVCPDTREETLRYALWHSDASAVVLQSQALRFLPRQPDATPSLRFAIVLGEDRQDDPSAVARLDFDRLSSFPAQPHHLRASLGDLATIVYTSGTTGRPKGVMLSHHNLLSNTRSIVEYLGLRSSDKAGMTLPLYYVYGNSVLQTHVAVGATVVELGSMAFPARVLQGIADFRCTGLPGVPSTFARLLQVANPTRYDLRSLRYVTQAGGPMTLALTTRLRQLLPDARLFVMYGQTEASARLAFVPPEDLDRKLGSAGKAIPGVSLAIVDAAGNELPRGAVGEIAARGDNVMLGYWRNPEETARVLRPEGLRTGDLARMDEDGFVYIVGRDSEMIKSGAHRIGPKEIEEAIEALPQVAECAVVGVPDELLGEAVAAFVVLSAGSHLSVQQVLRTCLQRLPRFKTPSYVRFVPGLPRTHNGKLHRPTLRDWFAQCAEPPASKPLGGAASMPSVRSVS
jgi:long-chain acyl-CoA synthetase